MSFSKDAFQNMKTYYYIFLTSVLIFLSLKHNLRKYNSNNKFGLKLNKDFKTASHLTFGCGGHLAVATSTNCDLCEPSFTITVSRRGVPF
jgi:hypothetical protein